jgi:hypothetical protein
LEYAEAHLENYKDGSQSNDFKADANVDVGAAGDVVCFFIREIKDNHSHPGYSLPMLYPFPSEASHPLVLVWSGRSISVEYHNQMSKLDHDLGLYLKRSED